MTVENIPMQGAEPTMSDATEGQAPSGDMFGDAIERIAGGVDQAQAEHTASETEQPGQHQ